MEYNKEVLECQYPVVSAFIQQLAYFRGLKEGLVGIPEYRDFWSCTLNNHLKQATVDWCKVFGSRKEDIHWTKTPIGVSADEACQHFRRRVLFKTGFNDEQWNSILKFFQVDITGMFRMTSSARYFKEGVGSSRPN
jgi:hypothetical protein